MWVAVSAFYMLADNQQLEKAIVMVFIFVRRRIDLFNCLQGSCGFVLEAWCKPP